MLVFSDKNRPLFENKLNLSKRSFFWLIELKREFFIFPQYEKLFLRLNSDPLEVYVFGLNPIKELEHCPEASYQWFWR